MIEKKQLKRVKRQFQQRFVEKFKILTTTKYKVKLGMSSQEGSTPQQVIKQRFINKHLKVVTKNGRAFEGRLVSIDFRSNLILHQSIAQIDQKFNCELNQHLDNSLDYKMQEIMKKQHPEWSQQQKKTYLSSHYYFGSIMISGHDIHQVLLRQDESTTEK